MFDLFYPASPAPVYPRPSISNPGMRDIPSGEMLPLVEESGIVYGQAPRAWCHGGSHALHPVIHLHIMDREGNVFLQRRGFSKRRYQGRWDMAVGGHVGYGEQIMETLFREAAEEIGLIGFNPIFLDSHLLETERESELAASFACIGHPDLHPDNAEVSEGRWWTIPEIEKALGTDVFTPEFEFEFPRVKDRLLSLL